MASRTLSVPLTGALLCAAAIAAEPEPPADEDSPDMAFLEYLGMWEKSDEDWQILDAEDDDNNDGNSKAQPERKASQETDDED